MACEPERPKTYPRWKPGHLIEDGWDVPTRKLDADRDRAHMTRRFKLADIRQAQLIAVHAADATIRAMLEGEFE